MPQRRGGDGVGIVGLRVDDVADGELNGPGQGDHPDDRRSVIVQLTAPGTAFLREILPDHLGYITSLITGINEPELLHLMETLEQVERNLEVDSGA